MAEAEIIPIGTRGRPGRGSGTSTPSAASRNLGARRPRPVAVDGPDSTGSAEARGAERAHPSEAEEPAGSERSERPSLTELFDTIGKVARGRYGEQAEATLAEAAAFVRRRLSGEYAVDDFGLDPELTERFMSLLVGPLAQAWFRIEVRGVENIPADGGALLVSNHSGTLPVDALVTMAMVLEHRGRHLRALGADLIFRLPFVGELARKGGVTLACAEDAARLLDAGELVGVWPEGYKGLGKRYADRYKLQRFGRGGFVATAIRAQAPIVPVSVVGAEEIYPLIGDIPALARQLGVPYIPITPFFPLLGPLGLVPLPSKWIIEFGEPIPTDEFEQAQAEDPIVVFDLADQVRETIQQTLLRLLQQRRSVFD